MTRFQPRFSLRLAASPADVAAAQALRYRVFVEELGADGPLVDHDLRLEADRYDPACEHLLLLDDLHEGAVVGVTRLMTEAGAGRAGGFATEEEFDIAPLRRSGRRLLELGRTCLDPRCRGGAAMLGLWQGIGAIVRERGIDVLFGLASFRGIDPSVYLDALSCLHHAHLAAPELRPRSRRPLGAALLPPDRVDHRAAMLSMPALVKAYLRLGGRVGEGACLDPAFGCIDTCMVLDAVAMAPLGRTLYAGEGP